MFSITRIENLFEIELPRRDLAQAVWTATYRRLNQRYALIHRHPELEICYCPKDSGTFFINDREYPIEPGDIFIVNGSEYHQPIMDNPENSGAQVIYFDPNFISSDAVSQGWFNAFLVASNLGRNKIGRSSVLSDLIQDFQTAFSSDKSNWSDLCRGILSHVLSLCHDRFLSQIEDSDTIDSTNKQSRFIPVINYIKTHLTEELAAQTLYTLSGLSKSQFSSLFKAAFGVSANQYILNERINRAIALMRSSELSITEICYACGFNSLSYFNKAFKTRTGASPRDFRNR